MDTQPAVATATTTTPPPVKHRAAFTTRAMNFRHWPIAIRLGVVFGIILGGLVVTRTIVDQRLDRVEQEINVDLGQDAAPGLEAMAEVNYYVPLMRVHIYRYAFFDSAERREKILVELNDTHDTVQAAVATYRTTASTPTDQANAADLANKLNEYWAWVLKTVDVVQAGGTDIEVQDTMAAYTALYNEIHSLMVEMVADNTAAVDHVIEMSAHDVVATRHTLDIAVLLSALFCALAGFSLARSIVQPLRKAVDAMRLLAEGRLDTNIDYESPAELGQMAAAFNHATDELSVAMRHIASNADDVAQQSAQLSATAEEISTGAGSSADQLAIVASASEQVSSSVQSVADALEQVETSIREISSGTSGATQVAGQAVTTAEAARTAVSKLGESSDEIGQVVQVIAEIAEQTNLLALNATIESARAGEAGKGFAVVASEVKDLAQETAKATDQIRNRVTTIQTDTADAVAAIESISEVIGQINQSQHQISSAVEEQTATAQDMTRSVNEGATGTGQIAADVSALAATARQSQVGATSSTHAARDLAVKAAEVKRSLAKFSY